MLVNTAVGDIDGVRWLKGCEPGQRADGTEIDHPFSLSRCAGSVSVQYRGRHRAARCQLPGALAQVAISYRAALGLRLSACAEQWKSTSGCKTRRDRSSIQRELVVEESCGGALQLTMTLTSQRKLTDSQFKCCRCAFGYRAYDHPQRRAEQGRGVIFSAPVGSTTRQAGDATAT